MKYILIFLVTFYSLNSMAQKPVIDLSNINNWPTIGTGTLSNDGEFAWYTVGNSNSNNLELIVMNTKSFWQIRFPSFDHCNFSADCKHLVIQSQNDTLYLLDLHTRALLTEPAVADYKMPVTGNGEWLAYKIKSGNDDQKFVLFNLIQKKRRVINGEDFYFDPSGSFLYWRSKKEVSNHYLYTLNGINLKSGIEKLIWQGDEACGNISFDDSGDQLTFLATIKAEGREIKALWYYRSDFLSSKMLFTELNSAIDSNLTVENTTPVFGRGGRRIFFTLTEKKVIGPKQNMIGVDIWSYKDKKLQSEQLLESAEPKEYAAVFNLDLHNVIQLQHGDEQISIWDPLETHKNYGIIRNGGNADFGWQTDGRASAYLISFNNGSKTLLKENISYKYGWSSTLGFQLSPDENYVIYFDPGQNNYYSYEINTGHTNCITKDVGVSFIGEEYENDYDHKTPFSPYPVGIAGWLTNDQSVLIYDNYDIWKVDPAGKEKPENITGSYGANNKIRFRYIDGRSTTTINPLFPSATMILSAFDTQTKWSGFYKLNLIKIGKPEKLAVYPCRFGDDPIKAKDSNWWLCTKMSSTEAPNYYITTDFINYKALSDIHPQLAFNWLIADLVNYKLPDGTACQGILYKPENFDTKKKYPLIFNYYDKKSDGLYKFLSPGASTGEINIPYFVSNGYLVFEPDIHFKIGFTGESALTSVIAAVSYLSKYSWIDKYRMGIQGHSFGGFETNYIVSHTSIFAAAMESAGSSDCISAYGEIRSFGGISDQYMLENDQMRIGASLSDRQDLYIANSPVLSANNITTPLLMMHNKKDNLVPFEQGVELFTGLRRLGKKVWMLQYDNGSHGISGDGAIDYTIRLFQFFDHYLKGAPPPKWMTQGIPARMKGIDDGLELDNSGRKP